MFILRSPMSRKPEREYIYRVILEQFLGVDCSIHYEDRNDVEISLIGSQKDKLNLADVLLQARDADWLKPASMPQRPLKRIEVDIFKDMPVLYGKPWENGAYVQEKEGTYYIGIDVFGSAFFMLTRYEELVSKERDSHERFAARQSLAWQERFLNRPIINEYIHFLLQIMKRLWPGLETKKRQPRLLISHDVDFPYYVYRRGLLSIAKESLGDIVRRHNLESGMKKASMLWKGSRSLQADPYNRFHYLMDLSERHGIQSAFYFITEETRRGMDGNYSIDDPNVQSLMTEIDRRGHEIGLHPSYDTYTSPASIRRQFEKLKQVAESLGIKRQRWGGRQHYLRWSASETWQYWEDAGLQYDSTVGYADFAGFRSGICYEYPVFNLLTRKALKLTERPLIVMDQTLLHYEYMHLDSKQALQAIREYYKSCMQYDGDFTLLWHNSQLVKSSDRSVYQTFMEQLGSR